MSTGIPRWMPLCAVLLGGCGLFTRSPDNPTSAGKIPAITQAPDTICLDIAFVERPAGDRLLGRDLWDNIDETGALDEPDRRVIREAGFRLGVVGSQPPPALEKMLGLTADFAAAPMAEQAKKLVGRQAMLRDGGKTEIQLGPAWPHCEVPARPVNGQSGSRKLEKARCVYQVTARRLEDGWVKLEFMPQVRHGVPQPVFTPGDGSWQFNYAQGVEEFPQQAFHLTLSLGEMAVLSAEDLTEGSTDNTKISSLGKLFFLGPEPRPTVQRLLVIRLANMGLTDDPYKEKSSDP